MGEGTERQGRGEGRAVRTSPAINRDPACGGRGILIRYAICTNNPSRTAYGAQVLVKFGALIGVAWPARGRLEVF